MTTAHMQLVSLGKRSSINTSYETLRYLNKWLSGFCF